MKETDICRHKEARARQIFGWLGSILLLLIIPVKILRFGQMGNTAKFLIGIAPSLLGPAGLLFLILSSRVRWLNPSLRKSALLVFLTATALEFAQLLPRPGFLKTVNYTFDWLDVISSIISLGIAYLIAGIITASLRDDSGAA